MSKSIETIILSNLLHSEEYCRKVVPFLKKDYFSDHHQRIIAEELIEFFNQYNKPASPEILSIQISNRERVTTQQLEQIESEIETLNFENVNFEWLLIQSEKFCKERAVTNAIIDSFEIISGKDKTRLPDAIPSLLTEALGVCFDSSVGHDYLEDYRSRFDYYHRTEEKIPFDLEMLNKITGGGLSKKTLNVILAGPKTGKTMMLCHIAASTLLQKKNVLYITMEMSENRIAERIDANLLDLEIKDVHAIEWEQYASKMQKLIKKTCGKLVIKEYPTTSSHTGHFRALLNELKTKKDFIPDLLIVDYLNICGSSRLKFGGSVNSYSYIKSIAEELRGLAQEFDIPLLSATQVNRANHENTDVDMSGTSDCISVDEKITLVDGTVKPIGDAVLGDQIVANDGYKTVMFIHHKKPKECVRITTKNGKSIVVSKDHVFPTNFGRCSINTGLDIGYKLNSR